jgi:PAP2 superfamily
MSANLRNKLEDTSMKKQMVKSLLLISSLSTLGLVLHALADEAPSLPIEKTVINNWYGLTLELIRHTPGYAPPVASRTLGYMGVGLYEALVPEFKNYKSLVGQLNALSKMPKRIANKTYDTATIENAVLSSLVKQFFDNTGPSGQQAMTGLEKRLKQTLEMRKIPKDVLERSSNHGRRIANAIFEWAKTDGGMNGMHVGYPQTFTPPQGAGYWVSLVPTQSRPLLPYWGDNRPMALKTGDECGISAPPEYSEKPDSVFYKEALEVYNISKNRSEEQTNIARFWSDDAMLSKTPPGHWMGLLMQLLVEKNAPLETYAEGYARLGIAVNDAFIGCWKTKYEYNLLRPVTYIKRLIDPKWESMLTTPPFPEYPSGHSTQSAAAAEILTQLMGENQSFTDHTHDEDGLSARNYTSFRAAASEAALSRLYGGIHYRAAVERGLEQGKCIGEKVAKLQFKR